MNKEELLEFYKWIKENRVWLVWEYGEKGDKMWTEAIEDYLAEQEEV